MVAAGTISVAVRVRPPTSWEAARLPEISYETSFRADGALAAPGRGVTSSTALRHIIQVIDDRVLCFDPAETDRTKAFLERGFLPPGTKRYKDKRFIFDRVLDQDSTQEDVYENTAKPLLTNVLDGFNATVFAYGATGCGKTHTISGTVEQPGVIYRTMADLFQMIEDRKEENNYEVIVTFLEIYNEEIRDLLAEAGTPTPRGGLQIREDKTVKVSGLVELKPTSADEVKQIVLLGNTRRTQSPTNANETSSRSHAVLQVHVMRSPRTASVTEERTMATLSIIDLAGSERAAATTNMGQRMVEGANINKSLLALGNCINSLCESGGAIRHVPYRNSKLTRLLKFSLGGNCKTVMIVCIAPTSQHFDDTHNTLIYAERATKIKTKVVTRNVVNVDRHVGQYVEAINRLNLEVAELKQKLAGKKVKEEQIAARHREEALTEIAQAKKDLERKADQAQPSLVDGAGCVGTISVSRLKCDALRSRLAQIDRSLSSGEGSLSELGAERQLLFSLLQTEERTLADGSSLNLRIQRSANTSNMFDAMLRAVTERRSNKLDEISVENVKLDARWRKAEMEKVKAEAQRDAVVNTVGSEIKNLIQLIGQVERSATVFSDLGRLLKTSVEEGKDGLEATLKSVIPIIGDLAKQHIDTLKAVTGESAQAYPTNTTLLADVFSGHARLSPAKSNIGIPVSPRTTRSMSRRSISGGVTSSPLRKVHRNSPRKGRTSIPRRVSSDNKDKEKKKGVQWKDEVGKGNLAESESMIIAPAQVPGVVIDSSIPANVSRSVSRAGSESEWEDEKPEESGSYSFLLTDPSQNLFAPVAKPKRRSSRLDPNFLRAKPSTNLGRVMEDEGECDNRWSGSPRRRASPLTDRDMNANGSDSSSASVKLSALDVPKGRDRSNSPTKRLPPAPKATGSARHTRRRSQIGPMRSERSRRRSSLIPQLSPKQGGESASVVGGPKRVPVAGIDFSGVRSPGRKPKRLSLMTGARSLGALRIRPSIGFADTSDTNISARGGSRPTWK